MATLSLGVLVVGYSQSESNGLSQQTDTGKVASILEDKYHVMGIFYALREEKIAGFLAESMAQAFEDKLQGRQVGRNPMFDAQQQIEAQFRAFLDADEMNKLSLALTGIQISAAAAAGISHRKKHPYAQKNKARPSFIDTGLYRASFRCIFKP